MRMHENDTAVESSFAPRRWLQQCTTRMALYDPACRVRQRTSLEVAWSGYGTFRDAGCARRWGNAWLCNPVPFGLAPARLIVESRDADTWTRSLTFVALASGGFVDLLNGGSSWGSWLRRRSTFFTTVAEGRSYDMAITSTNPRTMHLQMPDTSLSGRVRIGLFYSNPEKLVVSWSGVDMPQLSPSSYDFNGLVRPTADMPCGTNMFVGWENKLYVVVCGTRASPGQAGIVIRTLPVVQIVMVVGGTETQEVDTNGFFDPERLIANIVALFGIPANRVRVASIVPDSGRRRRQLQAADDSAANSSSTGSQVTVLISQENPCDELNCGTSGRGACGRADAGAAVCICHEGWSSPVGCVSGDCACSVQHECHSDCLFCSVANSTANCTVCAVARPYRLAGLCVDDCGVGFFAGAGGECRSCGPTCLTCSTTSVCDTCPASSPLKVHLGSSTACAATCPSATYELLDANGMRSCEPCHGSCKSCSGPQANQCTDCEPNPCANSECAPSIRPILDSGYCLSSCPTNKYHSNYRCNDCVRRRSSTHPCACRPALSSCLTGYLLPPRADALATGSMIVFAGFDVRHLPRQPSPRLCHVRWYALRVLGRQKGSFARVSASFIAYLGCFFRPASPYPSPLLQTTSRVTCPSLPDPLFHPPFSIS